MATMISDIVATGWKGGAWAMAGLARRSNAIIRIMAPSRGLLILFFRIRLKRIRGGHEELSPVRKRKIPPVDALQTVLREVACDDDLRSQRQRILIESSPKHCIRSAGFDFPGLYRTVGTLHIHRDPTVRIDPFDLFNRSLQLGRHIDVIFRGE